MKSFALLLCTALAFAVLAAGCGGSGGSTDAASFCSSFHSVMTKFQGATTSAQFQTDAADFAQLESSAPSAIKADWTTLSNAVKKVGDTNGDTSFLHTAAASAANQRVSDWAQANCAK